jgi:hypothetical protein
VSILETGGDDGMAKSGLQAFRDAPRGAKVVRAFASQSIYGEGKLFQEHEVPAGCWIDLGFEWQAVDVPTLHTTWPFIKITVTVNGEEIPNPKQSSKGPDELILQTPLGVHFGCAMQNALCIPPLPLGDHTIEWNVSFERDLDDGWVVHPKGKAIVITSLLHVVPPSSLATL